MAAVEGVGGLAVVEVEEGLEEEVMIEEGMIVAVILLEAHIVEDIGAGPGVMHLIKGCDRIVRPCTGTAKSDNLSRGFLEFTWAPGFLHAGAFVR